MNNGFEKVVEQVTQWCLDGIEHGLATVETLQERRDARAESLSRAGMSPDQSFVVAGCDRAIAQLSQ